MDFDFDSGKTLKRLEEMYLYVLVDRESNEERRVKCKRACHSYRFRKFAIITTPDGEEYFQTYSRIFEQVFDLPKGELAEVFKPIEGYDTEPPQTERKKSPLWLPKSFQRRFRKN